jgi:hypothetical protein
MEGTTWVRGGAPRKGRAGRRRGGHPLIPRDGEKRGERGAQGTRRREAGRPTQEKNSAKKGCDWLDTKTINETKNRAEKKSAKKDCDWLDMKTVNETKSRAEGRTAKMETAIGIGRRRGVGLGRRSEMEMQIGQQRSERKQARKRDGHCVVAVVLSWARCWVDWATVGAPRGQVWEGGRWQAWEGLQG